ncbi:hypothetical protein TRIATDRAFT_307419 [Trichoderma atroviride IMI 206040]|uniref:Uncharacterized protein n=1 Tax=Hypocrea atroviridis (strain ATCC 20476 / IMI 206040) TaxID=452589 RepID=G9NRI9_HYPAI|nr:uncharacterized protein TRIATDRAFT_307419 [Trichoderma atroviride IMI 206040]EHK46622.1 hypothetical protein TRIATDRAFT_307419 [Trichoderma atroviride IMI 206040]
MPPDSDPLCELGRMTEESALYQVDDEIATYSCHIDSILLLGKIDIVARYYLNRRISRDIESKTRQ